MAKDAGTTAYYQQLRARTQALRERAGLTQEDVGKALGIDANRYSKYETRGSLPLDMIERFCIVVRCTVEELITGKGGKRVKGKRPVDLAGNKAA